MFIVTIPYDSHKRLEKSTSTLPPLHPPLPIPQSTTKEEKEKRWGKESKFVVRRSRIVVLSVCFPLRSLLDKHSVVLRRNKEWQKFLLCRWRVGGETVKLQGETQFVWFFFPRAKIIQTPNEYVQDSGKKDACFLLSRIICFLCVMTPCQLVFLSKLSWVLQANSGLKYEVMPPTEKKRGKCQKKSLQIAAGETVEWMFSGLLLSFTLRLSNYFWG